MQTETEAPLINDAPSDESADTTRTRSCLRCEVQVESSGFGERICRRCKSSTTWRDGNVGVANR